MTSRGYLRSSKNDRRIHLKKTTTKRVGTVSAFFAFKFPKFFMFHFLMVFACTFSWRKMFIDHQRLPPSLNFIILSECVIELKLSPTLVVRCMDIFIYLNSDQHNAYIFLINYLMLSPI